MNAIVSRISRGQGFEFLNKLEAAGLVPEIAQRVIDSKSNTLAKKVVCLISSGGIEPSTGQKRAREIMGQNVFGAEEAVKHFGINFSKRQLAYLAEVPFADTVLEACKDTHILAAVFPLSILDIRSACKSLNLFCNDEWYNEQVFAKDKDVVGWYLVRKVPILESFNKTWDDQQALLDKNEETPKAQVLVYTIIGHFKATGDRLFQKIWVRCSDLDSDGRRVLVGMFDSGGLSIYRYMDGHLLPYLGLASVRNL